MNKIIFFIFIIVFLFRTGNVFSVSDIFYVDNITVNNNKNLSKEELLNKAFKTGFEKLIRKILLKKDHETVLKTRLKDVKKMVSSYEIKNNEDLNKTNDLAFNLLFDRERMNNFFYSKGISYSDIPKTSLLLFPVLIENNNFYLFSDNYFFTKWNIEDRKTSINEFVDYILPIENLEDIQFIKDNKNKLESVRISEFLSNYDVENYIFLIIKPSEKKTDIFLKGVFSGKEVIKNFVINTDIQDKELRFAKVIERTKQEINEIWKSQNLIDIRVPSFLNIVLDIKSQNDLLKIQMELQQIELIENFYVLELTKNYAKIRIKYFGRMEKIKKIFYEKGIELQNENNEWKISLI
tara:strand:+ start:8 stop:1060 length:1053 start_codon:yes stop_codon:yes gene_type:complete